MFHTERIYGRGVVTAYFLLLGIKSNALPNDERVWLASCTPYREGHFEAHSKDAFIELSSTIPQSMPT
jgi:hypothetical protein